MYAVIFEVEPKPGRRQDYLDIAAALKSELERIDGFISLERFQSLVDEGKILSLSTNATAVRRRRDAAKFSATTGSASRTSFANTA
jgi:heme-degrading monooxygenase HmoA